MKNQKMSNKTPWQPLTPKTFPPPVNWREEREIEGEIVEKGEITIGDRPASYIIMNTENGQRTVWITVGLSHLYSVEKGKMVRIEFEGYVRSKWSGHRYYKFAVFVKN